MKKDGYALIFTLIIIIPIIIFAVSILDSVTTDYKVVCNNINSEQSYYNAEAGIVYAKNKLISSDYKTKNGVYYLCMKDGNIKCDPSSNNTNNNICVEIYSSKFNNKTTFRIISTSNYFGFKQELKENVIRNVQEN